MATKKSAGDVAIPNVRNELQIEFNEADADLAAELGIDLQASAEVRTERAVYAYNMATRSMVEAGLLLASLKRDMDQPAFIAMLEEHGMAFQRAYELMRGASFAARLPAEQRQRVLSLPKTKVLDLASADPAVVQAMLEDGGVDLDLMSVRKLRERIADLEAQVTDTTVARDAAEAEAEALRAKAERKPVARKDKVPLVVADLRAEITENHRKAELAVDSFNALGGELGMLIGTEVAAAWTDGTARLAVSALAALRLQIDGQLAKWLAVLPDGERAGAAPETTAYLTPQEVLETAQRYSFLVATHEHEKALREWEREQARPRGKGRPSAKPEAPKGAE